MDNHEGYLVSMNHILVYIRVYIYIYTYKYIYTHMRIYYIDLYSIYNTCCGLISYEVGKLDAYPLAVLFIENMDTSSVT